MRLLKIEDEDFSLTKVYANGDDDVPPYAIVSHTWGDEEDEILMTDIKENMYKKKASYLKLRLCSAKAYAEGLRHIWMDTCCINKTDTVELTYSINSMYRWYQSAARCYVYLSDVQFAPTESAAAPPLSKVDWEPAFRQSRWFTRGWTLQELLAPRSVEFLSSDGVKLGDKASLKREIHQITGIDLAALGGTDLSRFSFEKRMSWAGGRRTKWEEDIIYSLLGIFGVHLPLIYGEGKDNAHRRLRDVIEKPPGEKSQPANFYRTESVDNSFEPWGFCNKCLWCRIRIW
ncbi:heterokaryon incompatibility protein-domain-containing protein [Xylaria flabelliformis]|nr:heterokaryon incompatibility protein-domain-containing protein [Xylaria flabelliformis]